MAEVDGTLINTPDATRGASSTPPQGLDAQIEAILEAGRSYRAPNGSPVLVADFGSFLLVAQRSGRTTTVEVAPSGSDRHGYFASLPAPGPWSDAPPAVRGALRETALVFGSDGLPWASGGPPVDAPPAEPPPEAHQPASEPAPPDSVPKPEEIVPEPQKQEGPPGGRALSFAEEALATGSTPPNVETTPDTPIESEDEEGSAPGDES